MRFSSAIVLAVVAALASSISAKPIDADVQHCEILCTKSSQCDTCGPKGGFCVSISSFPGLHDSPAWQYFPLCYGWVSCVSAFTSVYYGHWHWRASYHRSEIVRFTVMLGSGLSRHTQSVECRIADIHPACNQSLKRWHAIYVVCSV
jgi:hypothetical protein